MFRCLLSPNEDRQIFLIEIKKMNGEFCFAHEFLFRLTIDQEKLTTKITDF